MKKLSFLFVMLLTAASAMFAQIPNAINFQVIARDANGDVMANMPIAIRLSILDGSATGTQVYQEVRSVETNGYGSFAFQIGVDPLISAGDFSAIAWETGNKFMKVDYDPTASLQFNLTLGTIEFATVPYAFAAAAVSYIDLTGVQDGDVLIYNDASGKFEPGQIVAGTVEWSNILNKPTAISEFELDAGNSVIANVADPVNAHDAVNKKSVTLRVSETGDTLWLGETQFVIIPGISVANPQPEENTVTDIDGNVYPIVTIGTQTWMAEDLRVTKYPNGVAIPHVTDYTAWANLADDNTSDAYSFYDADGNGTPDNPDYGALYTYAAAIGDNWVNDNTANQGVCPDGWHLPTDAEWKILEMQLGMSQAEADASGWRGTDQGSQLAGRADLWTDGTLDANGNFGTSGFTALPGGYRSYSNGSFANIGDLGCWWSATEYSATYAWGRDLLYDFSNVVRNSGNKSYGFSVRCVRD